MKENLLSCLDFLHAYGVTAALRLFFRFIVDLIIVLSVATFFMRFCIITGAHQTLSLVIGMIAAVASNAYIKFRNRI